MPHIDLDFVMLEATDPEGMRVEAQAWVDEYAKAPGVTATIVQAVSPGGGWPEVRLSAATLDELRVAITAYDGDNGSLDELLAFVEA